MNWDEVRELAPLYALGALDAETARAVEASLRAASAEQRREIAEWREIVALLPQSLPGVSPPAHLKERLLLRIADQAQETPIETAIAESATEQTESKVLPFSPWRRAESRTTRWLLVAATILLALTNAYLLWRNVSLLRDREAISQELEGWKRQLEDFVSPGTKVIQMVGDETPEANAKVFWDTKRQQWVIYIFNLPAPPSDKEYQLWYVTKDAKISAAVFQTDAQGQRVLKLSLPAEALPGLAATAVTLEPKGGSAQPTGKFYLKAQIEKL
jgi:anti-sigma-K factor RskA